MNMIFSIISLFVKELRIFTMKDFPFFKTSLKNLMSPWGEPTYLIKSSFKRMVVTDVA
jgi:hypothetical protein